MALVDTYSKNELEQIISNSNNFSEVCKKLGYKSDSTKTREVIKKRIDDFNISISHFKQTDKVDRNENNIFIENSSACQATLRKWYKKGNYTEYKCSVCGQEPIWQGKELTLILDHINGINNDDRLENLHWVCPNCNQQLETTGSKNPQRKIIAKKYYCEDCGIEISKNSKKCISCFGKSQIKPITELPVTREDLKILIRTKSFSEIGRKFNVTDNAIRKWCDKYNLPRKKSDIKKYSDDAWLKI